ncbi:hypothetical protein ACFLS5_01355 [Candidatus Bipolaricaulota bacterium]
MWLKIVGWILLYIGMLGVSVYYAWKRKVDALAQVVYIVSYLINLLLPYVAVWYFDRILIGSEEPFIHVSRVDLVIIIHMTLTFLSASLLVIWGAILGFQAARGERSSITTAILLPITWIAGAATIATVLVDPGWFMEPSAYAMNDVLPWIWPATIDAPVTFFRMGLAATIGIIPFIRKDIVQGQAAL